MCAIAASIGLSLFQGLAMRSAATQAAEDTAEIERQGVKSCLLYTSPSPRDRTRSRMPSSA